MKTSYDEVRRISFRALDGARCAAGIDEDSAHAVAWLEAAGLPGLTLLADAIDTSDPDARALGLASEQTGASTMRIEADGRSCAFCAAAIIDLLIANAETGQDDSATIEVVEAEHPLFLIPMAVRFCPPQGEIKMSWQHGGRDLSFAVTRAGVWLEATGGEGIDWSDGASIGSVTLTCRIESDADRFPGNRIDQGIAGTLRHGLDVDDKAYARIATHAKKILVPETETSRVSGAGAGLTDND